MTETTLEAGPREVARQRAVEALGVLDTAATERFDRITRLTRQALGVEVVRVHFFDGDRVWAKSKTDVFPDSLPRAIVPCFAVADTEQAVVVPDLRADARFAASPLIAGDDGMRFYAGFPVRSPEGEVVGTVCALDPRPQELDEAGLDLLRDMAHWVQDEVRSAQEVARTARVQQGLLPRRLETLEGYDLAGAGVPVHAVGGDFYDWYPVRGGIALTLADVMGKGMAAAIVAATVRAVMRSGSRTDGPGAAVEAAAQSLDTDLADAGAFVTLFHAHLDETTGVVKYLDAGHGLTLIVRADGTHERLEATTMPLGIAWNEDWADSTTRLGPGDTLVSVSDGVLDALDGTLTSLTEVAALCAGLPTAQACVEAVLDRVASSAPDDVTVVVLRREAPINIG